MGLDLFAGDDAYLQQNITATAGFHLDISADSNGGEVIVRDDDIGDKGNLDTHVFKFLHWDL